MENDNQDLKPELAIACEHGVHNNLTLVLFDGLCTYQCDICKKYFSEAELINHGSNMAADKLLEVAKAGTQAGKFAGEKIQACADEILDLHKRIKFLTDKHVDK